MRITTLSVGICLALALSAASWSVALASNPGQVAAAHYANCTAMHKDYPHGVGKPNAIDHVSGSSKPVRNFYKSLALYNANKGSDRDGDGIACEQH